MDPKHRDRIAFIRVCSGKFERDMTVHHSRSEKKVRLSSSHKLFGNERETVDEAFPGDVIGLVGHDSFGIGDTLTTDPKILYKEIPRFTPEAFSFLHNPNTGKYKQFRQGLDQLLQEGVIQAFICAIRRSKRRCSPPSGRCNLKWCNSASKANTARSRGSNRRRGPSFAGCRRTSRKTNSTLFRCRQARGSHTTSAKIPSCFSRTNGRRIILARRIKIRRCPPCRFKQ